MIVRLLRRGIFMRFSGGRSTRILERGELIVYQGMMMHGSHAYQSADMELLVGLSPAILFFDRYGEEVHER